MAEQQNYTLGRGEIHFSRFKPNTQVPRGFYYIGNTPEFSLTIESENLDHFSSDRGIREKDDSVPLEVTRTGSMITDDIKPKNVALFFFGTESTVVQVPAASTEQDFAGVIKGHSYKLGQSAANPAGLFGLSQAGFNVSTEGAALVNAEADVTFGGVGEAGATITIGDITYTMVLAPANPYDVDIGGTATASAANLVAAINGGAGAGVNYGAGTTAHPDVTATNAAGVVTVEASVGGTAGNAIALSVNSAANITASGAALAGGTGASFVEGADADYVVDYDNGMFTVNDDGTIANGANLTVTFAVRGSTRDRVISGSTPVEGAMMFKARNPKGKQFNYYLPWVKITPNGDYALKGDEWQQIPFTIEVLKPTASEAIYMDGAPIYQ